MVLHPFRGGYRVPVPMRRAFREYQAEKPFPPVPADIVSRCRSIWPHAALAEKVGALVEQVGGV